MILQALYDYYQRKAADPDPARRLPAFGLEDKEIPFIIELTVEGRPLIWFNAVKQDENAPPRDDVVIRNRNLRAGNGAGSGW